MMPHSNPYIWQLTGVQGSGSQRLAVWIPQYNPDPQVPQDKELPQSSTIEPHSAPIEAHVTWGTQAHWFGIPAPPQILPSSHSPQSTTLAQPSERLPQAAPSCTQVLGVQTPIPHLLGPAPPQV
jgi:hypothetical protein